MKPSGAEPELAEVAPGVRVYIQLDRAWMINNIGAVVGSHDSLLVNTTSTEASNHALLASVAPTPLTRPRWRSSAGRPFSASQESGRLIGNLHRAYLELACN